MNTSRHKLQIHIQNGNSRRSHFLLRKHSQEFPLFLAVGDFYSFFLIQITARSSRLHRHGRPRNFGLLSPATIGIQRAAASTTAISPLQGSRSNSKWNRKRIEQEINSHRRSAAENEGINKTKNGRKQWPSANHRVRFRAQIPMKHAIDDDDDSRFGSGRRVRIQSDKARSLCDPQKRCKIAVDKKEREKQSKREWAERAQSHIVSAETEVVLDGVNNETDKKRKAKTKESLQQKKGVKKRVFRTV